MKPASKNTALYLLTIICLLACLFSTGCAVRGYNYGNTRDEQTAEVFYAMGEQESFLCIDGDYVKVVLVSGRRFTAVVKKMEEENAKFLFLEVRDPQTSGYKRYDKVLLSTQDIQWVAIFNKGISNRIIFTSFGCLFDALIVPAAVLLMLLIMVAGM